MAECKLHCSGPDKQRLPRRSRERTVEENGADQQQRVIGQDPARFTRGKKLKKGGIEPLLLLSEQLHLIHGVPDQYRNPDEKEIGSCQKECTKQNRDPVSLQVPVQLFN